MSKAPVNKGNEQSRSGFKIARKYQLLLITCVFTFFTGLALLQPPYPDPFHAQDFWEKWIYPQETNAFLRQQSTNADINDITEFNGVLWAVGDGGLILRSDDGGNCWEPRGKWVRTETSRNCASRRNPLNKLYHSVFSELKLDSISDSLISSAHAADAPSITEKKTRPSEKPKYEPAKNTTVKEPEIKKQTNNEQKTPDTKTQTSTRTPPVPVNTKLKPEPIPDFEAVVFISEQIGILVGLNGVIYRTEDAGNAWTRIDTTSSRGLYAITATDNNNLIAVGDRGTILRSDNGGQSWNSVGSSSQHHLNAITAIDNNHLITVGSEGTILQSKNAGDTWISVNSNTSKLLYSVISTDDNNLIAVGSSGTILQSENGGDTWIDVGSTIKSGLRAITVIDNNKLIAVGNEGNIVRTEDIGNTWTNVDSSSRYTLSAITTYDNTNLIAVGSSGTILRSDDSGKSWNTIDSNTGSLLNSVTAVDNNILVAVGRNGTILRSNNAGQSWKSVDSSSQHSLSAITHIGNSTLISVGANGSILRSKNSGKSWKSIESETNSWLTSIASIENNQLFILGINGMYGTALLSNDTGISWNPIDLISNQILNTMIRIENKNLIALGIMGFDGTILRSNDGGISWKIVDAYSQLTLRAITAIDKNILVAVGDRGTILRSDNAGLSWTSVDSSSRRGLTAITAIDNNNLVAVGSDGTILRSDSAGLSWISIDSTSKSWLRDITAIDNNNLVAVGVGGTILRSDNAGLSWEQVSNYSIQLANWWYLLSALLIGIVVYILWPREITFSAKSITGLAASDRPLQPGDPDALNLSRIALDIANFFSNPKTTAPFTLAVTGQWGSGKSSLMNLVCSHLKKRDFSTVWFNAWHHQKGEQLLATLFAHIKQQAIPSLFSFDGLWFRIRLVFIRSYRHWFWFALLFLLLAFTLTANGADILSMLSGIWNALMEPDKHWSSMNWPEWKSLIISTEAQNGDWLGVLASIFGIGAPLVALLRALRGFALNPKRLISVGQGDSKQAFDPGARAHFASEFSDVTRALGSHQMVIFIDDLDRCSQENLIDILENINFISSSGNCFLVLGMAPKYIEACVANHYQALAKSIAEKENYEANGNSDVTHEREEGFKFDFAHNYLEKMINIQVDIPPIDSDSFTVLLTPKDDSEQKSSRRSAGDWFDSFTGQYLPFTMPLVILVLAIVVGVFYGLNIPEPIPKKQQEPIELSPSDQDRLLALAGRDTQIKKVIDSTEQAKQADQLDSNFNIALQAKQEDLLKGIEIATLGQGKHKAKLLLRLQQDKTEKEQEQDKDNNTDNKTEITPVETQQSAASFRPAAIPDKPRISAAKFFSGLVIFSAWFYYLYRKRKDRFHKDSEKFTLALKNWTPWIKQKQETPREIKRFLNHLRFLAVRNHSNIQEDILVAFSSIYFINRNWVTNEQLFKTIFAPEDIDTADKKMVNLNIRSQLPKEMQTIFEQIDTKLLTQYREQALEILQSGFPSSRSKNHREETAVA